MGLILIDLCGADYPERTLRFELLSGVLRVAFDRGNSFGQQLINDLQVVKNYLGSAQIAPLFDAPWAPVFLLIIWVIHPWMGIFATVSAVVLMLIAVATDLLTRKKMKEMDRFITLATLCSLGRRLRHIRSLHPIHQCRRLRFVASVPVVRTRGGIQRKNSLPLLLA